MPASRAPQLVSFSLAEKLLQAADVPSEWSLTIEQFQLALERSATKKFCNPTPAGTVDAGMSERFLIGLQLRDLALACACSAQNEAAWEYFVAKYRSELQRAARSIAGDSRGRDLADSIYAELYGLRESEGFRRSLFDYFHGRSKLSTWLYAILARRHVDQLRHQRREEPLDDPLDEGPEREFAVSPPLGEDPERERYLAIMQAAMTSALESLAAQDRLRLAYYYVEDRTLVEIGKLFGEHEATASRKLERARREVREMVESILREERKLSEAQVQLCFQYARQEWPFDLTRALSARD